jgi:hypothetical protein
MQGGSTFSDGACGWHHYPTGPKGSIFRHCRDDSVGCYFALVPLPLCNLAPDAVTWVLWSLSRVHGAKICENRGLYAQWAGSQWDGGQDTLVWVFVHCRELLGAVGDMEWAF